MCVCVLGGRKEAVRKGQRGRMVIMCVGVGGWGGGVLSVLAKVFF